MKRFTLSVMVLMAFLCVVLLSPFAPSESTPLVSAAATWKPFPGRLAYSCDGGYHDKDDIAANPFLLLLLYKAGLADKLVHFEYANHIWLSDATQLNSLISATNEAVTRFGFNPNIFYNCMNANKDPIYNHLRDEILASTASNPLTICGAGPMHTIYQALSRANAQDPSKLQYVTVISHSPKTGDLSSNNEHGLYDHAKAPDPTHTHKNPTAKVWDDIAADFPSVKLVIIRGQNGPGTTALERNAPYDFRVADSYNAEQWMEDSTDDDIRWVWENMNAVHGTLNDVSDAGMVWYWMTGGDAYGDFVKTKVALTSDYILDLNFNSDTLSSPPSGWVDITGDVTIANVPSVSYVPAVPDKAMENTHFKDKCIKINDTTSSSCTATKVFADQSADFVVDYDFMVSTASADYVGIEVKNSTGDAAVMVKTVGSNISYKTGGSWTPITSYTQNKWHHITIYANKGTNKCSIIVDGKLEVDNLDMATVSNPINNITFKTGTTYQGVAYFDNLKIFSPSAAPTPTPTPSPTPTPAGDYLIDDNFNNQSAGSTPTGWTVSGDVKVANIPSASDKSIKFNDTDASTLTAVKGFAQQTGAITVEYDFMVPATVDFAGLQLEDGSGTTAIVLKTRYGQIAYKKSDDSWANLQAYNPNTWYSIRIEADVSTDTYSVYVNGVERANGVAFNRAVSSIEQIKFTTGSSYTGLMYVDNVKVYKP
ncbi:MAG: hypothetical protein BWY15_00944 [Firmicutes bacterium ADurb.Bin193]|nr:MAG: hypothetical protein BWY15_00944 [Firmicutes bacterium ADurb.Bin193]